MHESPQNVEEDTEIVSYLINLRKLDLGEGLIKTNLNILFVP